MQHDMQAHYPAPVETVLKMFTDPAFHERKLEAMGLPGFRILESERDGAVFRIKVERTVGVSLPGMKKGGATSKINHTERWNVEDRSGQVEVEMPGMPLTMRCDVRMESDGDGCTIHYRWDVKSSVPVIGKQIEKYIVSDMDARAGEEAEAAKALLDDYRE